MKRKNIIISQFLRAIPFFLVLATVWIVAGELPNGTVTGKYFWFYGVSVLISVTVFIFCLFEKKTFRFSLQDFFALLFCVSGLAVTWFHKGSLSNKWVILLLMLPLYFCFRYILQDNRKGRNFLLFFLLITGLVEALWGLLQLYGFYRSYHNLYPVTGSFFNPGPYAGYLAVVFPLALYYSINGTRMKRMGQIHADKNLRDDTQMEVVIAGVAQRRPAILRKVNIRFFKRWRVKPAMTSLFRLICVICVQKFYFAIVTCIAIILVLPATMSRAAWLAAIAGSAFVLITN